MSKSELLGSPLMKLPIVSGTSISVDATWNSWTVLTQVTFNILPNCTGNHWKPKSDNIGNRRATICGGGASSCIPKGLETLFALLCAAIQAPDCVVGWVTRYQNKELESVVKRVSGGSGFMVRTRLSNKDITWDSVAEVIFLYLKTGDESKDAQIKKDFSQLWSRFSYDLVDRNHRYEYNSMKHGLRTRAGGFHLAIGREDIPGVPAPPERMRTMASSDFGSSFFVTERLHDARNFAITTQRLNWDPENLVYGLQLIAMSISNVISFFKTNYGVPPGEVKYSWCSDKATYDEPWKRKHGSTFAIAWHSQVEESEITPLTKEEILAVYDEDEVRNEDGESSLAEIAQPASEAGGRV